MKLQFPALIILGGQSRRNNARQAAEIFRGASVALATLGHHLKVPPPKGRVNFPGKVQPQCMAEIFPLLRLVILKPQSTCNQSSEERAIETALPSPSCSRLIEVRIASFHT